MLQFHQVLRTKNNKATATMSAYTVKLVPTEEIPRIVEYLIEFYFTDEPLSKDLNLTANPKAVDFLRRFCTDALKEGISLMATTEHGDIAAVSCNTILRKEQKFHFDEDEKVMKITKFVLKAIDEANVFEQFPDVNEAIYIAFMSVHPDFRNKGLAKYLIEQTKVLALKKGLKVMRMDCCSLYTAKAARRFGWQCLNEIKYVDYVIDGVQVFKPEEPHTCIGVYATRITDC